MSERVLDSTGDRLSLLLVVAVRVLRDPILALDAAADAMTTAGRSGRAGSVEALEHLGRVIDAALREERVPAIERRRNRELFVASVVRRLEREAPTLERLARIAASRPVVGVEAEVGDRDGA